MTQTRLALADKGLAAWTFAAGVAWVAVAGSGRIVIEFASGGELLGSRFLVPAFPPIRGPLLVPDPSPKSLTPESLWPCGLEPQSIGSRNSQNDGVSAANRSMGTPHGSSTTTSTSMQYHRAKPVHTPRCRDTELRVHRVVVGTTSEANASNTCPSQESSSTRMRCGARSGHPAMPGMRAGR